MASSAQPPTHLERDYLPVRAKILEIAASLDRIQRSSVDAVNDPRWEQLQAGLTLLLSDDGERAEEVQLLFSRPYDQQWRETLDMPPLDKPR